MSPSPLQLLIIDDDPIFRIGLRAALEPFSDLEVIADVESQDATLQVLVNRSQITARTRNLLI
jgi:DNA-binding NarL/FixJ family response regulator